MGTGTVGSDVRGAPLSADMGELVVNGLFRRGGLAASLPLPRSVRVSLSSKFVTGTFQCLGRPSSLQQRKSLEL